MSQSPFQQRVGYQRPLQEVLAEISQAYGLGTVQEFKIIEVGFEDLNVVLTTEQGPHFVKIFSEFRSDQDCKRYLEIIHQALAAGVVHPELLPLAENDEYLFHRENEHGRVRALVMEYITGQTFYQLKTTPTAQERASIIDQVAKLHQSSYRPSYYYDEWAVVNILTEYPKAEPHLNQAEKDLLKPLIARLEKTDLSALPTAFVHGDLITANIMRSQQGQIYLLDFSVANVYPRIQELAVLLCDPFFDANQADEFLQIYEETVQQYQKSNALSDLELETLPLLVQAAHAMHIIASVTSKLSSTSEEQQHWIEAGRHGLAVTQELFD